MTDKKATLTINDSEAPIELGVLTPTLGPDVLDVRALGSKGYFTFDPGFTSTASCESKITFIDGDKGVLLHRGFPIEQLAKESSYRSVLHPAVRRDPNAGRVRDLQDHRHPPHHDSRPDHPSVPWFPSRLAPDGGAVRCDRRAGGVLPRCAGRQQRASP